MSIVISGSSGITYPSLSSAPSSPVAGMTYYNSTDLALYVYDGATWNAMNEPYIPFEVTSSLSPTSIITLANGAPTYINDARDAWQAWQNLETNWIGAFGTNWINNSANVTFTLSKDSNAYLIRKSGWGAVDLTGWTLSSSGSYITGYGVLDVYTKTLTAGDHSLDTYSAMYIFTEV